MGGGGITGCFFHFVCLFDFSHFFFDLGPETGSRGAGRGLKRFLEAVGSILAEFGPKPSHGSPIRHQNCGFGTYDMC